MVCTADTKIGVTYAQTVIRSDLQTRRGGEQVWQVLTRVIAVQITVLDGRTRNGLLLIERMFFLIFFSSITCPSSTGFISAKI